MALILVRGAGDVGSSVALTLFRAGHRIVLHDAPRAAHARRGMSFTNALFKGKSELGGTYAKYAADLSSLQFMLRCGGAIPVVDSRLDHLLRAIKPAILVDARMRKHTQPEVQRGLAPHTIGLGPNFVAGETTDIVVETAWGLRLGAVIHGGRSQQLVGEPQKLGGHCRERFVYAPCAGEFRTELDIGDLVIAGQEVGQIDEMPVLAPLTGRLRGLAHDGALIEPGAKIVEVDASADETSGLGVGVRPQRIAEGVLTALSADPIIVRKDYGRSRPFAVGAVIGVLGDLIGLGGAEFRLPALVGMFRLGIRDAILFNLAVSLITVVSSLGFRAHDADVFYFSQSWLPIVNILAGTLVGTIVGSHLALRLKTKALLNTVSLLLTLLALGMIAHGVMPAANQLAFEAGPAIWSLGAVAGVLIGVVSSILGIAGGEFLIPTLVLLYGIDIKIAGTLSLVISIPTLLFALFRFRNSPSMGALRANRALFLWLAVGSMFGAYVGSRFADDAPLGVLSFLLGAILLVSAYRLRKNG